MVIIITLLSLVYLIMGSAVVAVLIMLHGEDEEEAREKWFIVIFWPFAILFLFISGWIKLFIDIFSKFRKDDES